MNKCHVIACAAVLAGCTYSLPNTALKPFPEAEKLSSAKFVYVVTPKDGRQLAFLSDSLEPSEGSGRAAAETFADEMGGKFSKIAIGPNAKFEDALKAARATKSDYMLTMDVHEWKDSFYMNCQSTQSAGGAVQGPRDNVRDTADVTLYLYSTDSGKLVNKQRLTKRGCPAIVLGFIPVGSNSPEGRFGQVLGDWYDKTVVEAKR
jgi:hypothetical protein